jgi:UDP:flavonoid glycosyltransferase YjiC (YdhE family)
VRIALAFTLKN